MPEFLPQIAAIVKRSELLSGYDQDLIESVLCPDVSTE